MKLNSAFTKLSVVALAALVLNSCKKEDEALNNNKAFRGDDSQAQVLDMPAIDTDKLLTDRVNGVDYVVNGALEVNAGLTIQPGVTIMFADGASLKVNSNGYISAVGEEGNEIYFTSKSKKRGAWKGITIESTHAKNVLSYVLVEHGNTNVTVGTRVNGAKVEISNSEITAAKTDGISIWKGSLVTNFSNNNVHTNSGYPVSMYVQDVFEINNTNQFTNNGQEYVHLIGEPNFLIQKQVNVAKNIKPYLLSGSAVFANEVTVNSGVSLYMDDEAEIIVDGLHGNGYLQAIGYAGQPITINTPFGGAGVWGAIRFLSSGNGNRLEYCNISGGGYNNAQGMISVESSNGESSNVVIRNCNIMNSAATGIYITGPNSQFNSDINDANTFVNNAGGNVHIE